jgi:hypothetical protein
VNRGGDEILLLEVANAREKEGDGEWMENRRELSIRLVTSAETSSRGLIDE